jgi:hypothetical protein
MDFGHADGPIDVDGRLPSGADAELPAKQPLDAPDPNESGVLFRGGGRVGQLGAGARGRSCVPSAIKHKRPHIPHKPKNLCPGVQPRGRRRPRYERGGRIPAQQPEHGASSTGYVHETARNEVRPRRYANAAWTTLLRGLTESGVGRSVGAPVVSAFPTGTSPVSAKRVVETGNPCLKKRAVLATSE